MLPKFFRITSFTKMKFEMEKEIKNPEEAVLKAKFEQNQMRDEEVIYPFALFRFSEYYEFYLNEAVPENELGDKVWTAKFKRIDGKVEFSAVPPSEYSAKLCFCDNEAINSGT